MDLKFSEDDIQDFWFSIEYQTGFNTKCNSTLIGSIERYIKDYNWEDTLSKEEVSEVYSYVKELNKKSKESDFHIDKNGIIYRDNFPNNKFDFDNEYGFASFHLKVQNYNLKNLKENIYKELNSMPGKYRVYVNSDKISVYPKNKFKSSDVKEKVEYYINGVNNLVQVIKKISTQII